MPMTLPPAGAPRSRRRRRLRPPAPEDSSGDPGRPLIRCRTCSTRTEPARTAKAKPLTTRRTWIRWGSKNWWPAVAAMPGSRRKGRRRRSPPGESPPPPPNGEVEAAAARARSSHACQGWAVSWTFRPRPASATAAGARRYMPRPASRRPRTGPEGGQREQEDQPLEDAHRSSASARCSTSRRRACSSVRVTRRRWETACLVIPSWPAIWTMVRPSCAVRRRGSRGGGAGRRARPSAGGPPPGPRHRGHRREPGHVPRGPSPPGWPDAPGRRRDPGSGGRSRGAVRRRIRIPRPSTRPRS